MGNTSSQGNARSLREVLTGLDLGEQHKMAASWAIENHRAIDLFGEFASERHLLLFQSGNECENWIDPISDTLYKMNNLTHVGDDILRLLDRIDAYNMLFPETALHLVGIQIMSPTHVFPVFSQIFIKNARFATNIEITEYMHSRGFEPMEKDGSYSNGKIALWDIKPKNVLVTGNGATVVIDAEIEHRY